jgi:hypothetical protein
VIAKRDDLARPGELGQNFIRRRTGTAALAGEQLHHPDRLLDVAGEARHHPKGQKCCCRSQERCWFHEAFQIRRGSAGAIVVADWIARSMAQQEVTFG